MYQKIKDITPNLAKTYVAAKQLSKAIGKYIKDQTEDDLSTLSDSQISTLAKGFMQSSAHNPDYEWSNLYQGHELTDAGKHEWEWMFRDVQLIIKNKVSYRKGNMSTQNRRGTKTTQNRRASNRTENSQKSTSGLPTAYHYYQPPTLCPQTRPSEAVVTSNQHGQAYSQDHRASTDHTSCFSPSVSGESFSCAPSSNGNFTLHNASFQQSYTDTPTGGTLCHKRKRSTSSNDSAIASAGSPSSEVEFLDSKAVRDSITAHSSRSPIVAVPSQVRIAPRATTFVSLREIGTQQTHVQANSAGVQTSPPSLHDTGIQTSPIQANSAGVQTSSPSLHGTGTQTALLQSNSTGVQTSPPSLHNISTQTTSAQVKSASTQTTSAQVKSVSTQTMDDESGMDDTYHVDYSEARHMLESLRKEDLDISFELKKVDKMTESKMRKRQDEINFHVKILFPLVSLNAVKAVQRPDLA